MGGPLHVFANKSKRVPASSSNTDLRKALKEIDRRAHTMKQPRGGQDKCIMEMIVRGFGLCDKDQVRFNRPCKHQ